MRTNKASKRKGKPVRVPARPGLDIKVGADVPRCVTCGQPLVRLPRYLGAKHASDHGFQCQRCFYANTPQLPTPSDVIASERTRWLTDVLTEPRGASNPAPAPPRESED